MRIFVTGTGRCGTSTFYQACRHVTNYTAGHESKEGRVTRHFYPNQHIEISSHLVPVIPILLDRYPSARWVHMIREKDTCIQSLVRNMPESMACYARQWFYCDCNGPGKWAGVDLHDPTVLRKTAEQYYDHINSLCLSLLPDAVTLHLEEALSQWPHCWDQLGLEGNLEASLTEWTRAYNHTDRRGLDNCRSL